MLKELGHVLKEHRGRVVCIFVGVCILVAAPLLVTGHQTCVGVIFIGALVVTGFFLAWSAKDREDKLADLGRGLVASAVLAIAFAVFNHAVAERDAQESAEQAQRDAQHSFEQTISLQRDLSGAELSERDLEAVQLAGKRLVGADLSDARMEGVSLIGANLVGADLTHAHLRGADLGQANLEGAILQGADLRDAQLVSANLNEADLRDARLGGADMEGTRLHSACLIDARLDEAQLAGAELYGAQLIGTDLSGAILKVDLRPAFLGPGQTNSGEYLPSAGLANAKLPRGVTDPAPRVTAPSPLRGQPPPKATRMTVTYVSDGDTMKLDGRPSRLLGIDAPTLGFPPGDRSADFVRRELLDQPVEVERYGSDKFDRQLVYVWSRGRLFNQVLVGRGEAVATIEEPNQEYDKRLMLAEEHARDLGLGLWRDCV